MKISVTTTAPDIEKVIPVSLLSGDFSDKLIKTAQMGFNGIELVVNNPDRIKPSEIYSRITDSGLETSAISSGGLFALENLTIMSPSSINNDKAIRRFESLIEFAANVHAPFVTLGSFRGKSEQFNGGLNYSVLVDAINRLSQFALDRNIKIVIEPLNRYESNVFNTVDEVLVFIEESGFANLGVLFDTYHANIEEKSIADSIRKAANHGRLWHIHIGDSNRYSPGLGHINFAEIFCTLKSVDYQGFISAELLRIPDPDKAALSTINYCLPFINS